MGCQIKVTEENITIYRAPTLVNQQQWIYNYGEYINTKLIPISEQKCNSRYSVLAQQLQKTIFI